MNLDQFLTLPLIKPTVADSIDFQYENINFHVYGVLHGITGGTNSEYKEFINHTISQAKGIVMSEKMMKSMYKGISYELDDWLQVPFKDSFLLTLKLFCNPTIIYVLFKTLLNEDFRVKDKFNLEYRRIQDLGGSPYFHLLNPIMRRLYMGFPSSSEYFKFNFARRNHLPYKKYEIIFSDFDWRWLTYIESNVNIPYRSIHMLENAVLIAKDNNFTEVSLFVGETHNSDMIWYVQTLIQNRFSTEELKEIKNIKNKAIFFHQNPKKILVQKMKYLSSVALAASIPVSAVIYFFCSVIK